MLVFYTRCTAIVLLLLARNILIDLVVGTIEVIAVTLEDLALHLREVEVLVLAVTSFWTSSVGAH